MLELNTSYNDLIMVIELNGALDSRTGFDFYEFITEKILEGKTFFALDCTNLEFLSSGGISAIVGIHNVLKKRNGLITLFRVRKEIFQLVEFLNLQKTIAIHEGSSDALNWIKLNRQEQSVHPTATHTRVDFFSTENRKPKTQNIVSDTQETIPKKLSNTSVEQLHSESAEKEHSSSNEKTVPIEKFSYLVSSTPQQNEETTNNKEFSEIIYCSHCGKKLLVKRKGKHMCPVCQNKFYYPPQE